MVAARRIERRGVAWEKLIRRRRRAVARARARRAGMAGTRRRVWRGISGGNHVGERGCCFRGSRRWSLEVSTCESTTPRAYTSARGEARQDIKAWWCL